MSNNTQQVFLAAYNDIRMQAKWTQGYYARDKDGAMCDYNSPRAVCWCSAGILSKYANYQYFVNEGPAATMLDGPFKTIWTRLDKTAREMFGQDMLDVNDKHPHNEVVDVWHRAGVDARWL